MLGIKFAGAKNGRSTEYSIASNYWLCMYLCAAMTSIFSACGGRFSTLSARLSCGQNSNDGVSQNTVMDYERPAASSATKDKDPPEYENLQPTQPAL